MTFRTFVQRPLDDRGSARRLGRSRGQGPCPEGAFILKEDGDSGQPGGQSYVLNLWHVEGSCRENSWLFSLESREKKKT